MKYFDYAATCPLDQDAANAYVKAATEYFGNTQSLHDFGTKAASLLESCREKLAAIIGVEKDGLYFTSGGSESNFLGICSLLPNRKKQGKHIITGIAEHSSIKGTMEKLEEEGYRVTYLPLNENGEIDLQQFQNSIRDDTVFAAIQFANPEIGTIQPIKKIGEICKKEGIIFFSDCVHCFGKIDLKPFIPYLDGLSLSAHKFYGPKGVGAVYINPRIHWRSFFRNASHEKGFRPGTVNVPAITAMAVAAEKCHQLMEKNNDHYRSLRKTFLDCLNNEKDLFAILQHEQAQITSTVGLRVRGKEGHWVMLELKRRGFAVSTGSACRVGTDSPSKTMEAMGFSREEGKEFIRISFGIETKEKDVEELVKTLIEIAKKN